MGARHLLEQATRSWVFRRKLPAAFGYAPLYVSPAAGLRYLAKPLGRVDEALLRNATELVRPGDVVWDIGANVGLFTFAAAALAGPTGQVISFEPDVWLAALLHRSCRLQRHDSAPIIVVAAAVAAANRLRPFQIATRSRSSNALAGYGLSEAGGVAEKHVVPTFNLDYLLEQFSRPNILKCDVEGAELEVFFGQKKFFDEARPLIICEVSKQNAAPLTELWRAHSYELWNGEKPLDFGSKIEIASWNTIAVPDDSLRRF